MDIEVERAGLLRWDRHAVRCALGRGGVSADKREGDGATPTGCFPLRAVRFRPDRFERPPRTHLPIRIIARTDGWCDDPADSAYNRPVRLPYPGRHETLWRTDGLYDVVVELGYNDSPVVSGHGSAVFLHVARDDYDPTEGCVAIALSDLLELIAVCGPGDRLCVR